MSTCDSRPAARIMRRRFLQAVSAAAAGVASPWGPLGAAEPAQPTKEPPPTPLAERLCLFTDHLDHLGYSFADVAKMLAPLKIVGPDLTVRGGGLVLPERVHEDLPKAAAAFREVGLTIPMITTNLTTASDPTASLIFAAMRKLDIRYYKLGYYHYHDLQHWEVELAAHQKDLEKLVSLGRQAGAQAGFHNHAGAGIGGAVWDAWEMLKSLDPAAVGFYFDPGHASIEGAIHAWKLNFQRISSRLAMVALKDYVWEKTSAGWRARWCPLGEGMVPWDEFFQRLVQIPFPGPVSIHIEYDPGGATPVERIDNNLAAAERDLAFVRGHLAKAMAR